MSFKINKITINNFRRNVMYAITKNIGTRKSSYFSNAQELESIKKVLVLRPNHRLGNLLLTTPLIEEITNTFPNCKIDILVKGDYLAPIVFGKYNAVNEYLALPRKPFNHLIKYAGIWLKVKRRKYDLVINAVEASSSGRLLTQLSKAKYKIFGGTETEAPVQFLNEEHIAIGPIFDLRYFLKTANPFNDENVPLLDIKLTEEEKANGLSILKELIPEDKPIIAIFTFATGTKCYCVEWWNEFYTRLKAEFTNYKILEVLPIENVSQIQFKATTYYSKGIREIASVISNTKVFIGADSGMMHLASTSLTPTIGLFSKANIEEYKPYGKSNFAIDTNTTSLDDTMKLIADTLRIKS